MTLRTLLRRSLRFHARSHLGVLLGAIIGSAALIGALVVGDSVRASLRERTLNRLGWVNLAMETGDRFFSIEKALADRQGAAFALHLSASFTRSDGEGRANRVNLFGISAGFAQNAHTLDEIGPNSVVLNEALANQLGTKAGDEIQMRIEKSFGPSREVAVSPRNASTVSFRLRVQGIASADEMGDFSLRASQTPPLNAFMRIGELGVQSGISSKANILVFGPLTETRLALRSLFEKRGIQRKLFSFWLTLKKKLGMQVDTITRPMSTVDQLRVANGLLKRASPSLSVYGFNLQTNLFARVVELRSDRIFLDPVVTRVANQVYSFTNIPGRTNSESILTYLANLIRVGTNATPYSMVSASGPPFTPTDMKDDEIILNQWLAYDLHASPGDIVDLSYFLPESGAKLLEATNRFRVHSMVPMELPWADRTLMPDFPGIENAESTADWDAGFPLVYKIRPKDEDYWKKFRGTPKAFITLAAGQKMWANRFGNLTSVRFPIPPDEDLEQFRDSLDKKTLANLNLSELGFHFEPVREQALKAANQAQDFGDLFLGFSIFLIVAALVLMALLFQFGLEQRATEIGTFLALGFTPKEVRKLLLKEGTILAALGGLLGTFAGLGYAKAMLWGLTTIWRNAIGTSSLTFHASPATLSTGLIASVAVSTVVIWFALRKQAKRPARELLAGEVQSAKSKSRSWGKWIALGSGIGAVATIGWALATHETSNAEVFFSAGSLLLIAGLGASAAWLATLARKTGGFVPPLPKGEGQGEREGTIRQLASSQAHSNFTLSSLAVRGTVRRRTRSLATIALLASGSFLIASIGVFRLDANLNASAKTSGTGGFALIGESTMPIVQDLNSSSGREFFGLGDRDLQGVSFVAFRVHDGDDASCLNLNRAQRPRLLGVNPSSLVGRFTFGGVQRGLDLKGAWNLLRNSTSGIQHPESSIRNPASNDDEIPAIADANSIEWALGKKLGDTLDYTDEHGHTFKLRLVGSLANSILQGSLIIDEAEFTKRFPSESGYRMFLLDVPTNSIPQISATLSRAMQDVGLELTPTVQRLNAFNAVQNTYLGTFQILGGLGLLLGSAGLGIVVLRNVLERRGELGLLTAVGFTRGSLQKLLLGEHGALLVIGLALGIFSAAVAVLPSILSPAMHLPWRSLTLTLGAVLLNGLLWTWLATRYALRGNLLAALRNE